LNPTQLYNIMSLPNLQELLDGYPMIRDNLLPYFDRVTQYVLRLTIRRVPLIGMSRERFIDECSKLGYFELLKWEDTHEKVHKYACVEFAALYGHLEVVEWATQQLYAFELDDAMKFAAKGGHIHIVQFLVDKGIRPKLAHAKTAIEGGQEQMLGWLRCHFGVKAERVTDAIKIALKHGHITLATRLVCDGAPCGPDDIYAAASLARNDFVAVECFMMRARWNDSSATSLGALKGAVKSDNIEFAEKVWSALNPIERLAAQSDRYVYKASTVEMVQWAVACDLKLHSNKTWRSAVKHGNVDTLAVLRAMWRGVNKSLHFYAARHRHHHVTVWLLENAPECKFNENLYSKLIHARIYDLSHLAQHDCPRDPVKCGELYKFYAAHHDIRAMAAMRRIGCPFNREEVWQVSSREFRYEMQKRGW
jgi:hypothetical protein